MHAACARQVAALAIATVAACAPRGDRQTVPADAALGDGAAVIFTGRFITLDSLAPRAEALGVRDGRIVAVGSVAQVDSALPPATPHVALAGVVVPGLADAHVHAAMLGDLLESVDLRGASRAQVLERVAAAAREAVAGAWIRGGGWDQSFWDPPDFPTAAELDGVSDGHPVILERIDGHAIWVNTRAMQLAGITRETVAPVGGRIVRTAAGEASGVFIDEAMPLVRTALPPAALAQRVRRLQLAMAQYARWGVTSLHDAGVSNGDLEAYRAMLADGPLPVRAYVMASTDSATLAAALERGPEIGVGGGTFTLRAVKIVDDGALGSRGARLSTPYSDDAGNTGLALVTAPERDTIIARSLRRGFQVAVHAIGDASNHDVLEAFFRTGAADRASRLRLEHVSMLRDEDVSRLAALGVVASMQPVFVGEYSRFAEARVGMARLPWVYRTRDVVESGAVLASGTDFPASDTGDPIATLASLVTREGYDGTPTGGWLRGQRVSIDVALRSMTSGAAYAAQQEHELGMLRAGYLADLTVLSADPYETPPAALRTLRVLRTIVGGRTTFQQ